MPAVRARKTTRPVSSCIHMVEVQYFAHSTVPRLRHNGARHFSGTEAPSRMVVLATEQKQGMSAAGGRKLECYKHRHLNLPVVSSTSGVSERSLAYSTRLIDVHSA